MPSHARTRRRVSVVGVALVGALVLASCSLVDGSDDRADGPAQAAASDVERASGAPASPVVVADGAAGAGEPDQPADDGAVLRPVVPTSTVPVLTGWAAFDASLRDEILGGGSQALSVAVAINGELVHEATLGRQSPESIDPANVDDRFRVASISKPITAITVMQLVEDGLVGLDQAVGAQIAAHVGIDNPSARASAITVRQLLTHTSGFPQSQSTFFSNRVWACPQAAAAGLTGSIGGNGYDYSNMNYCVLGMLIEQLTGQRYEEVVYERLLTPLGISGMRMAPTYDPGPSEIEHYTTDGRNYMEALGGAGAWVATAGDIVTILDSIDLSTPGWKPLTAPSVAMMKASGTGGGDRGYGMGLLLYGDGIHGHTGTLESTHAMVLNRNDGVTWAVLVAGSTPSESSNLRSMVDRAFAAGGFVFA
ncbi:MAG: beta-lactamase family protein [Ilumatobacteraceae bacterium]|nr:beta-lactamase family protein [Ilumatobacteraceae bacterium]